MGFILGLYGDKRKMETTIMGYIGIIRYCIGVIWG